MQVIKQIKTRWVLLLACVVLCHLCHIAGAAAQPVIDAGELTCSTREAPRPLSVHSPCPELQRLAQKLFGLHGAYTLSPELQATWMVHLEKVSPQGVQVWVETPRSGGRATVLNAQFSAKTWEQAALKACDAVVEKTLGLRGFFATELVFVGQRPKGPKEVYLGDILFLNVRQLTHDRSDPVMPHASADGRQLLYTSYFQTGFPDIFVIDMVTGVRKPFASYSGVNTGGVFSPRGDAVAMVLSSVGQPEVYVSDMRGKNLRRLTRIKSLKASPSWTLDGEHLVYVSDELGGPQLYQIHRSGGTPRRLPTHLSRYCVEPRCSPTHLHQVAFTAAVAKGFQIALYDAQAGTARWVTQGAAHAIEPCWMPDGRHLVFTQRVGNERRLALVDTVSGKRTLLSPSDFGQASMASVLAR
jgi:TolB protein